MSVQARLTVSTMSDPSTSTSASTGSIRIDDIAGAIVARVCSTLVNSSISNYVSNPQGHLANPSVSSYNDSSTTTLLFQTFALVSMLLILQYINRMVCCTNSDYLRLC